MPDRPQIDSGQISRQVIDALSLGVVLLDARGDVLWADHTWNELCSGDTRIPSDSYVVELSNALRVSAEDVERILLGIGDIRNGREDTFSLDCASHATAGTRWLCVTATRFGDDDGRLVLLTHQDITERKLKELSLELYRDALDCAAEVIIIADADGMIQYVNPAFTNAHDLSAEAAIGQPIWDVAGSGRDQPLADAIMPALRAGKPWREERPVESDDRALTWEARSVSPIRAHDGSLEHLIVIGRDVTEERAYVDQLRRHAYYDSLTGLPNRTLFIDRLAHAHLRVQRNRQPLAVMYLDLNGFKSVNDSFGHGVGDQVLAEVAQRLTHSLRVSDTVARTGGDEFIFLLEELGSDEDAVAVARRLIDDIARPLDFGGEFISVSGSIGIAFNTDAVGETATLLELADIALYHAKARSEDRVMVYHEKMEMPNNQRHDR